MSSDSHRHFAHNPINPQLQVSLEKKEDGKLKGDRNTPFLFEEVWEGNVQTAWPWTKMCMEFLAPGRERQEHMHLNPADPGSDILCITWFHTDFVIRKGKSKEVIFL